MGSCSTKERPIKKEGTPYLDEKPKIRPLDLIFFHGDDLVSDLITVIETKSGAHVHGKKERMKEGRYVHVGIAVTSEILDHPRVEAGKIYVWESTMSGRFGAHVNNVDGEWFLGVQLRELDNLVRHYDEPNDTRVAVAHLSPAVRVHIDDRLDLIKTEFSRIFHKYNGKRYDANPISLVASFWKPARVIRKSVEEMMETEGWLFCSEMVATVFKELTIFPPTVDQENVLPCDLLGYDSDTISNGGVPIVVEKPIDIVSDIHL